MYTGVVHMCLKADWREQRETKNMRARISRGERETEDGMEGLSISYSQCMEEVLYTCIRGMFLREMRQEETRERRRLLGRWGRTEIGGVYCGIPGTISCFGCYWRHEQSIGTKPKGVHVPRRGGGSEGMRGRAQQLAHYMAHFSLEVVLNTLWEACF